MSTTKKELIIEFEYLEKQITASTQKLDALDKQAVQLTESIRAIKIVSEKESHESLIPLVSGVYVNATVKKTDTFLVDVGSDIAVPKTATQAIDMFEFQLSATQEYQEKILERLELLSKRADELQKQLVALSKGKEVA